MFLCVHYVLDHLQAQWDHKSTLYFFSKFFFWLWLISNNVLLSRQYRYLKLPMISHKPWLHFQYHTKQRVFSAFNVDEAVPHLLTFKFSYLRQPSYHYVHNSHNPISYTRIHIVYNFTNYGWQFVGADRMSSQYCIMQHFLVRLIIQ